MFKKEIPGKLNQNEKTSYSVYLKNLSKENYDDCTCENNKVQKIIDFNNENDAQHIVYSIISISFYHL